MGKFAQRGPRQQGGADTARNARGGDRGGSESRPSGSQAGTVAAFQELMDRSPRVQTQLRLGEALQRRALALTTGTKPVVQRLKTAGQFGLDESSQGDLIALINEFHELRLKFGNGPYDNDEVVDALEDKLKAIRRKAEDYDFDHPVALDVGEELEYLWENKSLRVPAPDPVSSNILTNSNSSIQKPVVASSSVRDQEVDPVQVAQYKGLILHTAYQDYEDLIDDQEELGTVEKELDRLELEDPERILYIWREGLVGQFLMSIAKSGLIAQIAGNLEIEPAIVNTALFGLRVPPDMDDEEIQAKLSGPLRLYKRIVSILQRGVLPPSSLAKSDYKGSSDIRFGGQEVGKASYFDIDIDRNPDSYYDERFKTPGHSSVSVALEREGDRIATGREALDLALAGNVEALAAVREVQSRTKLKDDPIEQFMTRISISERALADLGNTVRDSGGPLFRSMLARRAANTAMVVSAGDRRQSSNLVKDRWIAKHGPKATELRAPIALEPEAISYVILPAYMEIFRESLERRFNVGLIFAGNTEIDISYFDAETQSSVPKVRIPVPNYQRAIEELIGQGNRQLITHVTRV